MGRSVFIFLFFCALFRTFPLFIRSPGHFTGCFWFTTHGTCGVRVLARPSDARRKARGGERTMPREFLEGVEFAPKAFGAGVCFPCAQGRRKAGASSTQSKRFASRGVSELSVFRHADCVSFMHNRFSHNWGREGKCCIGCIGNIGCIGYFSLLGISPGRLRAQGGQKPASLTQARSPGLVSAAKLSTATSWRRETARSRKSSPRL